MAGGEVPPQFSARRRKPTKRPALHRSYFDKYHELDKTDLIQENRSKVPSSLLGGDDAIERLEEGPLDPLAARSSDRLEAILQT